MNAPTYINSAHRTLARNPGGLTLDEIAGKIRAKAKKVGEQIRELHDLGMIQTEEEAGQPVYKLVEPAAAAPVCDLVQTEGESQAAPMTISDSEGGEADAPVPLSVVITPDAMADFATTPELQYLAPELQYLAPEDYELPPADPDFLAQANRALGEQLEAITAERDDLRARLDAVTQQSIADTDALTAQIDRLKAEIATERHAREALQEQAGDEAVDVKDAAVGYLVRVPKRAPLLRRKPESARAAALSAVRAGAARAEVLAVVPVGTARRGAEWRGA